MKRTFLFLLGVIFLLFGCKKEQENEVGKLPAGVSFSKTENVFDLVYGGSGNNDDELVSGMVADKSGNMYITMNVTTTDANKNIIVAKINSDGTLGWGYSYDTGGEDWSPDSGENGETGGTAGSISMDSEGNIYFVGTTKNDEIGYAILVVKINTSGSIVWQKAWKPSWPNGGYPTADQDAEGYAIDATGDNVLVTGTTGTNEIVVLALNKNDGSIVFQKGVDVVHGTKDRGYAILETGGNIYVAGVSGSTSVLAKLNGTTNPDLAWIKNVQLGWGARINQLITDGSYLYYSCDIRGAQTTYMVLKTDLNASFVWAKYFESANNGDRNNTHVVYLNGNDLWTGGRIGITGLDQFGDAILIKMDKNNGDLKWCGVYYTGQMSEEVVDHRIKGIAVAGNSVYVVAQAYPTDMNPDHYRGYWLESNDWHLGDASVSITDITSGQLVDYENGEIRDINGQLTNYSVAKLQPSEEKTTQNPPDCDAAIMKFEQ